MTKTKYLVYKGESLSVMYVTTKRNCEDMIQQIRKKHEYISEFYSPKLLIKRVINGEETIVYTRRNRRMWDTTHIVKNH